MAYFTGKSWFKDYVYFPLGGSRKGLTRTIINSAVVWFLTGFWHGANWTYMVWGLYFFVFISIEKIFNIKNKEKYNLLKHMYALSVVMFGWILFRSDSLGYAIEYIQSMFGMNLNVPFDDITLLALKESIYFLGAGILFSMPIVDFFKQIYLKLPNGERIESKTIYQVIYYSIYTLVYISIFLITVSYIVKGSYNPFIYFNF